MKKSLLTKLLVIAVIGYPVILFLFYLFRNQLIFQRDKLDKEYTFQFEVDFEEHYLTTPDNAMLHALHFRPQQASKGLVFYLHGNANDLRRWGHCASDFTSLGYDVFMMDYRGYGKSEGTPSEAILYRDASFVLQWIRSNIEYDKLIVYGRSLGAAVATHLASESKPDLLVLETPFAEFSDVIYWALRPALYLFPFETTFSNVNMLPKVQCRKIIFHGTNDWVVPLSSAKRLKPWVEGEDFIIIEGGGHKNLREFDQYHDKLAEILR